MAYQTYTTRLEDKWIRLTASVQRALLGAVVFGKQQIRVSSSDSTVTVYRKCAFGQDFESLNAHASLVAAAARSGKVLSPGKSHGKYFTGTCSDNGVSFPLSHQ